MAPDGCTFSNGDHVPFGFTVTVPAYALQRDKEIFDAAETFNVTRYLKDGNSKLVNGRDHFLSFGFGAHTCPGRSIALTVIKLMLAEILLKYEIQPLGVRPRSSVWGNYIIPDTKATMFVRAMVEAKDHRGQLSPSP
ncbi:hypothetical protein LTR42_007514 [Elasticomyces elasticus]|nr:hypothetical protein LTR42_007514 [Elasticomyces elasticus]